MREPEDRADAARTVPVSTAGDGEERFRALAEHARDSIVEISPDGRMLYVSPSFTEMTGFAPEQVLGRNGLELVHPDDLREADAKRARGFAEGASTQHVFRCRHARGHWIWVEVAGRPYRNVAGEPRGVLISRDVTSRVEAQRALEEQLESERRISELARSLLALGSEDFEAGIREGLAATGAVARAQRVQFFVPSERAEGLGGHYQWCAEGVAPRPKVDLEAATAEFGWTAGRLIAGEIVHVPRVEDLPDAAAPERRSLGADGVRSYLALPIRIRGQVVGFLDFHRLDEARGWSEAEISRLGLVAEALSHAVLRLSGERRRRVAEARMRLLTEQAEDTICEMSVDGRVLYLSPNFEKLCGYRLHELRGVSTWSLVHPEDRAEVRRRSAEAVAGSGQPVTYRVLHRTGGWRWLEATVRPFDGMDGERSLAVVVRDVTERQERRLELERQLELEKRIADFSRRLLERGSEEIDENIRDGLELAALVAGADRAYLLSSSPDGGRAVSLDWQAPGTPPRPHPLGPEEREQRRWVAERLARGEIVQVPRPEDLPGDAAILRRSLMDDGVRSFLALPILEGERLMGVLGFHCLAASRDWTPHEINVLRIIADLFTGAMRRKRAEAHLRESQHRLLQSQKMEAIGTLAGGIAHDFNNQLTVMLANTRYLREEMEESEELGPALRDLERAAEHCAQLTSSLLAFSRRAPSRGHGVDADRAVGVAEELLRPLIPSSIRFAVELEEDLGALAIDQTPLQQVLVNLVVNARDAMPHGGDLRLRGRVREIDAETAQRLGLLEPGHFVELSVRDTGVGMDADTRSRIFEPFFTTKPVGQGTGLGLATAYGIVQGVGGVITVESQPGRGATFTVLLPRSSGPSAEQGVAKEIFGEGGTGTVLVAEDEPAVRRVVARALAEAGYRVMEAGDGAEALRLGRQCRGQLDAVVTDVEMPRLDGVELARRLKRERPDLPVLFISGTAPVDVVAEDEAEGSASQAFLPKPFSDRALLEALGDLLEPAARPRRS